VTAEKEQQQVGLEGTRWQEERYAPEARKALSIDGGMVYVRGEGWKELKVGLVADLQPQTTRETSRFSQEEGAHLTRMRYGCIQIWGRKSGKVKQSRVGRRNQGCRRQSGAKLSNNSKNE
jgi:hypothetical protein